MITVISNSATKVEYSSPKEGGVQVTPVAPATATAVQLTADPETYMTKLGDVDSTGLNDNDIMVYDQVTGMFKPVDAEIINNNDGGTW